MMTDEKIKLLEDSPVEAAQLLRVDFELFIKVFHWYIKRKQFTFKQFHKEIVKELESIVYGEPHNLIISMPPRWGKSAIMRYFLAWTYAINRNCNNIYTSYADDLVRQFSGEIRDLINSDLYKKLFGLQIKEDTSNKGLWQINNGGMVRACSMGGAITGFGFSSEDAKHYAGCLVIDDSMKADDARSEVAKKHCIDYFNETLMSRRNNEKAPIIIIMQRLAVDDLVGYLNKETKSFTNIVITALDENNKSRWEERFSTESLLKEQREHPYYFAAQQMQNPILAGGNVIHVDKFRTYKELPDNILYTKVFCDFAMTAKTHSDYSVFLLCGFTQDKKMYVIDMWRNRWEVPDLTKFALTLWKSFKNATNLPYPVPRCMCIEQKASGIGVLQEFKKQGIYVEPLYPTAKGADGKEFVADKFQRVCDILPEIEVGNVYIPDKSLNKVWLDYFLKELREFTADDTHEHDDCVDCTCYSIKELIKPRMYATF